MRLSSLTVLRRIAFACLGGVALICVAAVGILIYPQPLFAYHVAEGRLELYSDRPFDPKQGRQVLANIERRMAASPLNDDNKYRIFIANSDWRNRLVFLWSYGAGGVNYYPLRNVFIRAADIDADRVKKRSGALVEPPRTLAYFGAHEIGHSLVAAKLGALAHQRLPVWIREGLADYIAFGGEVEIDELARGLRRDVPELDPQRSGLYARYRLMVAYLLEREDWTIATLLKSPPSGDAVKQRLLKHTKN